MRVNCKKGVPKSISGRFFTYEMIEFIVIQIHVQAE